MSSAINIEGLVKRFPRTGGYRDILTFWRRPYITALSGADLQVPRGGIFGLLGPNGAGKTTLLKILSGLVIPDEGTIEINGVSLAQQSKQVKRGLMYVSPEERSLNWRLTGLENLYFYATLYELPRKEVKKRVHDLLSVVGLTESAGRRVGQYSSGMRQRLSIARGLMADPDILLLDEPTRSLDPVGARQIWEFIQDELVVKQGRTILLATHNMEEATTVCKRVAIMHHGKVRACNTVEEIAAKLTGQTRYLVSLIDESPDLIRQLQLLSGVTSVIVAPPNGHPYYSLEVTLDDPEKGVPAMLEHLVKSGSKIMELREIKSSLGDAMASLVKETP